MNCEEKKLITELEAEIDTLEQEISKLNEKLLKEEVYLDYQKQLISKRN